MTSMGFEAQFNTQSNLTQSSHRQKSQSYRSEQKNGNDSNPTDIKGIIKKLHKPEMLLLNHL